MSELNMRTFQEICYSDFLDVLTEATLPIFDWKLKTFVAKPKEVLDDDLRKRMKCFAESSREYSARCSMKSICELVRKELKRFYQEQLFCSNGCDFLTITDSEARELKNGLNGNDFGVVVQRCLVLSNIRNGKEQLTRRTHNCKISNLQKVDFGNFKEKKSSALLSGIPLKANSGLLSESGRKKSEQTAKEPEIVKPVVLETKERTLLVEKDGELLGRESKPSNPKKRKQKTGYILKVGEKEGVPKCIHHFKAFTEADKRRLEEVKKKSGIDVCLIAVYPDGARKEVFGWEGFVERRNKSAANGRKELFAKKGREELAEDDLLKNSGEKNEKDDLSKKDFAKKIPLTLNVDSSDQTVDAALEVSKDAAETESSKQREFNPEAFFSRAFLIGSQNALRELDDSPSGFYLCWFADQWGGHTFIGGAPRSKLENFFETGKNIPGQKLFCFPLALMNGAKVSEPEVLAILATLPQFLAE